MKVILNKDIANLGEEGEIKDVARGYARNYLIPNKLVMPHTREAIARMESRRGVIEERRAEKRRAATDTKTRLQSEPLTIQMPAGERGRLFGSVTSGNIAEALAARGIEIERRRIDIPEKTIKNVGTTYVRVRLYGDEEAELRVDVTAAGAARKEPEQPAASAQPAAEPAAETAEKSAEESTEESDELDADAEAPQADDSYDEDDEE
jgi:large subunit ribosomal protein L9